MTSHCLNRAKYFLLAFFILAGFFVFFQETHACTATVGPTGGTQQSDRCGYTVFAPSYIADFNGSWFVSGGFSGSGNVVLCVGNTNGSGTWCDVVPYNNAGNASGGIGADCLNSTCNFADLTVTSINTVTLSATANLNVIIPGCTDPGASNYDPAANMDNGSCIYPVCTDPAAGNFNGPLPCQYVCGNGVINPGEVCDGSNFNGATCGSFGFAAGNLNCVNNCDTISTSGCGRYKCTGGTGCSFVSGDGGANQCAPPTDNACLSVPASPQVTIYCNGLTSSCTISSGSSATISWLSTNATSCSVPSTSWSGTSGSQSTGPLTSNRTYTVNCTGLGGNAASSVAVTIGTGIPATANLTCDLSP